MLSWHNIIASVLSVFLTSDSIELKYCSHSYHLEGKLSFPAQTHLFSAVWIFTMCFQSS